MKTDAIIVIAICMAVVLIFGIVTYGIVIDELNETPYEQCVNNCYTDGKNECVKSCTEYFKEIGFCSHINQGEENE